MKDTYSSLNSEVYAGKITQTATVTFVQVNTTITTPLITQPVMTTLPVTTGTISQTTTTTALPTSSPVAEKTTYAPLPEWTALLGIVVAGLFVISKKR
jgi:hypothetical protein